ncbi:MAG: Smr/MutS family protein [Gammaproteobacteria bacterium]|nr:Smr/MutS family protein [Gammaproteobacteria bacterium]
MKKKPDRQPSDEDIALFREAVKGVQPLSHDKVEPHRSPPPPRPVQRERDAEQVMQDMMSDEMDVAEVETGEELLFHRPGLQTTVLRKLRRGQFAIEAELDLHGMRIPDARNAIALFLGNARSRGLRCVRIIHGKGHGSFQKLPVLKNKVNAWLRQRDEVMAFTSARSVDGGTGAVYVLIRRN